MNIWGSGPGIFVYHILPSALAALVYLLLAQFFIFLFRIKRPSFKYAIYLVVLYKSVLLLIAGAQYSNTFVPRKSFSFGFQFYDPINLIPFGSIGSMTEISNISFIQSQWFIIVISMALAIIILMLILRWLGTYVFFVKLIKQSTPANKEITNIADRLMNELKTKKVRVILSDENIGPLVIGFIKPTIMLSKELVKNLNNREIEVMLGHEFAHVKRKDNLWQWPTLFLKDLLFFSPFSKLTYGFSQLYKEIAADNLFLAINPEKTQLLIKTIKKISNAENLARNNILIAKSNFADTDIINKRLKLLEKRDQEKIKVGWLANSLEFIGLFIFFWTKFWIAIKLGLKSLMLLS